MCTRANRASVPDSLHALVGSFVGVLLALLALFVALATWPVRWCRPRPARHGRPASTAHVAVQVHLSDRKRVAEIERGCRAALGRSARTWAPHPLPLDRIEVLASAPPLGKVDLYDRWVAPAPNASAEAGRLVVVSVGTANEYRELSPDEIAGAVAGQIAALVADRYQREHAQDQPAAVAVRPERAPAPAPARASATPAVEFPPPPDNVTELDSVRSALAELKRSQPLVPAGSSENGVHPEPNPA